MSIETGYRTNPTQEITRGHLETLYANRGVLLPSDVKHIHLSHSAPKEGATRPGIDPLFAAFNEISSAENPNIAVSVADHEDPSAKAEAYTGERNGINITLNRIITPELSQILNADPMLHDMSPTELMKRHGDTVHLMAYLNSHNEAIRSTLQRMGHSDPDEFLAQQIEPADLAASAFVDAAVGSWVLNTRGTNDLLIRDDWPPANIVRGLNGKRLKADIGDNHGVIPQLDAILNMHPLLQEYQLRMFGNMLAGNKVIGLHTKTDIQNLQDIGDYLLIAEDKRAKPYVRYLMPPSFTEFKPSEKSAMKPAPFLEKAVAEGKVIAQVVERLDPIKDDLTCLDYFEQMIVGLAGNEEGKAMLKDMRVGWVSRPANFPDGWKSKGIYDAYTQAVDASIHRVNALHKQVMQTDEDFILAHRDANGRLSGYQHDKLKTDIFPYANITFQLGQEGLCQTIQEGVLTTTFGLEVPRPAATVVSQRVGFAEKAQEHKLGNTHVVADMETPEGFIQGFVDAYKQAVAIRDNPGSDDVQSIYNQLKNYYDNVCGDSFYHQALHTLVEVEGATK